MANWKKVDADQLDADMTTVANAIRNRAGTTEQMEFPGGFVSAVESITNNESLILRYDAPWGFKYENTEVTSLTSGAFRWSRIGHASFPNVTIAGQRILNECSQLTEVNMPKLATLVEGGYQFASSTRLTKLCLPALQATGAEFCNGCTSLAMFDTSNLRTIATGSFKSTALTALILRYTEAVCSLSDIYVFNGSPIASGTGYIYVPRSLVDTYKSATNWSNYASQIRAIEDYPDITGG